MPAGGSHPVGGDGRSFPREETRRKVLVVRAGDRICALPVEGVIETMRPLPIEERAGMPAAVLGISVIRGEPTPVVDLADLLGLARTPALRFVTVRSGDRQVAIAVSEVVSVDEYDRHEFVDLPPLLSGSPTDPHTTLLRRDGEFATVLEGMRLVEGVEEARSRP